ncbi:hypothetical protein [Endothiovibrio diazotrophicus]
MLPKVTLFGSVEGVKLDNKWVSISALVISFVALFSSIRSCSIAENAFQLQAEKNEASKRTAWVGKYDEASKTISIKPSNPKVVLLRAKAFYPDVISKQEWPIEAPEYKLHLTSPVVNIQKAVDDRVKKRKGYVILLDDSRIPIVIEAYYTIDGELFMEKSLYSIEYQAIIRDEEWKPPYVKINALLFNQRLPAETDSKAYINAIWQPRALSK